MKETPQPFEWSVLGPVAVELHGDDMLDSKGEQMMGCFIPMERVIKLDSRLSDNELRRTQWHEWIHLTLFDSGLSQLLLPGSEEAFADTFASALTAREDFHASGGVPHDVSVAEDR